MVSESSGFHEDDGLSDDFANEIDRMVFEAEFTWYYDYLETIADFLENERKKLIQSISDYEEKLRLGQIAITSDPPQEYEDYEMDRIEALENTLFNSFFVMIYFYLESELTGYCRGLQKQDPKKLALRDISGNGIEKAIKYLVKVHNIEFVPENSQAWKKLQGFNLLRNCIVHNQGRIDESFTEKERLLKFIQEPGSLITLQSDSWFVLDKRFCRDALETIKGFMYSIYKAKANL